MNRFTVFTAAVALAGAGTVLAAAGAQPGRAASTGRGTFNPFTMQRAPAAPNGPSRAALARRQEILRRLAAIRVTPPGAQRPRSPSRPGRPGATPPPFTPPGGGTGTNPGGNTTGSGNSQSR